MEHIYKKSAISYGLTLGMVSALITVLIYALNLSLFTKWYIGIITFLVALIFGILSAKKTKELVEDYTSFKQAFSGYFITIAIGLAISTAVSILLFNVVDPEAALIVQEEIITATEKMMQNFGAPQESIDISLAEMENSNQFGLVNQLKGYVFSLAFYAVIGLIVALIFREKDPTKV